MNIPTQKEAAADSGVTPDQVSWLYRALKVPTPGLITVTSPPPVSIKGGDGTITGVTISGEFLVSVTVSNDKEPTLSALSIRDGITTSDTGTDTKMSIRDVHFYIPYEDALKFSTWILNGIIPGIK